MRTIVVLNGEPCDFQFLSDDFIIACDGALNYLRKLEIKPNVILGDFDSLGFTPENAIVYPVEKDFTDGELALEYAAEHSLCDLIFICAGGLREDHFLGNLALLRKAYENNISTKLETVYSTVYYSDKPIRLETSVGQTVSVIAVDKAFIKSSVGLKYRYNDTALSASSTLGISNVATAESIEINIKSGGVFVFLVKLK